MPNKCYFNKKNTLNSFMLFAFICFFCKSSVFCSPNILKNILDTNKINNYKHLDINNNNNKENIFKIDLTANPSKKSNSFIQIVNHKELYTSSFSITGGVKQYLHFHASVINKNKKIFLNLSYKITSV